MHLWATDFRVYIAGCCGPFQHFYGFSLSMIMSNHECRVFHPLGGGGGLTPTCYAQHTYFHFQNDATHFGRCLMLPSPPLNTKHSVDRPCTHDIPSNTKHNVDFYLALTPMPCDVLVQNAMQSWPIHTMPHTYGILYVHFKLCITPMHHLDNHINQHAISK